MNYKFDFDNFKPINTYYIKVDFLANNYMVTNSGVKLFMPDDEGDIYRSKPFHGELVCAPKNSKIPKGETVYVMYQAYDTLATYNSERYYVVTDDMIVSWGDRDDMWAYKSVLIDVHKQERGKLDLDLSEDNMIDAVIRGGNVKDKPTHTATVIAADNDWLEENYGFTLKKGDVIEYVAGLDWEFFVNRQVRYFIKWADRIIKKNGSMVNGYNELEPRPKYINKGGIILSNDKKTYNAIDGDFAEKEIYVEEKRVELGKYIKSTYVLGHII